jgi:DNA-binding transcriptional ArsR family regulator
MIKKEKQLLYQKQAKIAAAIGHPLRAAILDFLKDAPQCVCDIAEHVDSERSNVSRHLSLMVSAGLLEYEKQGLKVIYSLKTPCVLDFLQCMTECVKEQAKENRMLLKAL